jgi:hypothetical protein
MSTDKIDQAKNQMTSHRADTCQRQTAKSFKDFGLICVTLLHFWAEKS